MTEAENTGKLSNEIYLIILNNKLFNAGYFDAETRNRVLTEIHSECNKKEKACS